MNKLDTSNNGGMPLELDDFRHYFEGIEEALTGVGSTLGGLALTDGYILSGMVVTDNGSTLDITSGYCVFNGEIFYYPGGSGVARLAAGNKYIIEEDSSYLAAGNEQFLDGTTNDTYEQRRAKLSTVSLATTGKFDFIQHPGASPSRSAKDFKQLIISEVETNSSEMNSNTTVRSAIDSAWTSITMAAGGGGNLRVSNSVNGGGLINTGLTVNSERFRYKVYGKTAHIEFNLDCTMPVTGWGIYSIRFNPSELATTLLPKADNVFGIAEAESDTGNSASGTARVKVSKVDAGGTNVIRIVLSEQGGVTPQFGTTYSGFSGISYTGLTIDQTVGWKIRFTMTYELD